MTRDDGYLAPEGADVICAEPGAVKVGVLFRDETVWLTQRSLAELFGVGVTAVNKHLKHIFESGEIDPIATVSKMEMVRSEGRREVTRDVEMSNLDAIIEAAEKARQRRLDKLGLDVDAAWARLEKLVDASSYDDAMTLAVDLRDVAARDNDAKIFAVRFETMRKRLLRRRGFFDRWKRRQHQVAMVRP